MSVRTPGHNRPPGRWEAVIEAIQSTPATLRFCLILLVTAMSTVITLYGADLLWHLL